METTDPTCHREHGEVCPADWKPGAATMVADPTASLDYFSKQYQDEGERRCLPRPLKNKLREVCLGPDRPNRESAGTSDDIAPGIAKVNSAEELQAAIKSHAKLVLDFYAPW